MLQQRQGEILAKATEVLRKEHDVILKVIEATEFTAARLERGEKVPDSLLAGLVEFFQLFADRCHHGKEEDLLFPALEAAGVPKENGPIGAMLADHTRGREYIRAMNDALAGVGAGTPADQEVFAVAAHGYARLLSDHIEKENNVLFIMAERQLSPEEHERLLKGFERIEQERIGPGVHERYHAMLDRLRDKYLTTPEAS